MLFRSTLPSKVAFYSQSHVTVDSVLRVIDQGDKVAILNFICRFVQSAGEQEIRHVLLESKCSKEIILDVATKILSKRIEWYPIVSDCIKHILSVETEGSSMDAFHGKDYAQ